MHAVWLQCSHTLRNLTSNCNWARHSLTTVLAGLCSTASQDTTATHSSVNTHDGYIWVGCSIADGAAGLLMGNPSMIIHTRMQSFCQHSLNVQLSSYEAPHKLHRVGFTAVLCNRAELQTTESGHSCTDPTKPHEMKAVISKLYMRLRHSTAMSACCATYQ